jgi:hypothetical protein
MGKDVELDVLTDSRQLYCALQGHGSVKEKRLLNEVAALRQVLRKKEVTRVGFVRSEYNMAYGLTKMLPLKEDVGLTKLLKDGKLPFIVEEFLPRQFGPCGCWLCRPTEASEQNVELNELGFVYYDVWR